MRAHSGTTRCTQARPWAALTPLVRLQLRLQVLGGHVKLGLLALGRLRLALPAAAIEAAAQAAAAVAAGEEPTEDKQGLGGRWALAEMARDWGLPNRAPTHTGCHPESDRQVGAPILLRSRRVRMNQHGSQERQSIQVCKEKPFTEGTASSPGSGGVGCVLTRDRGFE